MRIAFVGKGGSGKTTLAVLFAQLMKNRASSVLLVDADLNIHTPGLLGYKNTIVEEKYISHPDAVKDIQSYLKKDNHRIDNLKAFRKTTPPTNNSHLIKLSQDSLIEKYSTNIDGIEVMIVGTYQEDGIGTSCYHNNLAIFENILTHLIDSNSEVVVADMVAGVDSFANTLHMQFDLNVLVVEPTLKGVGVYLQFANLNENSGSQDNFFVVGNKVKNDDDLEFLKKHIPEEKLLGFFYESNLVRQVDQEAVKLDIKYLEEINLKALTNVAQKLYSIKPDFNKRYAKLIDLHKKYVSQASIKERFGDLTIQIDENFRYE